MRSGLAFRVQGAGSRVRVKGYHGGIAFKLGGRGTVRVRVRVRVKVQGQGLE